MPGRSGSREFGPASRWLCCCLVPGDPDSPIAAIPATSATSATSAAIAAAHKSQANRERRSAAQGRIARAGGSSRPRKR